MTQLGQGVLLCFFVCWGWVQPPVILQLSQPFFKVSRVHDRLGKNFFLSRFVFFRVCAWEPYSPFRFRESSAHEYFAVSELSAAFGGH